MTDRIKFTFIDLFAGIGGFRIGLEAAGGKCINFSEINKDAIDTYCSNFNEDIQCNLGDITKIKSLPPHGLLTGGVPCQSWSIAGRNLGFDDDRGQLWNDTIFLLNQSRPKAFIFENVKGLVDPRNREAFSYIIKRIEEAGYHATPYVINSFDYGVPQNRVRVYIVGFLEERFHSKFRLPSPLNKGARLGELIKECHSHSNPTEQLLEQDLFGNFILPRRMSLSATNGLNDYFLFNDIRNGHSTIHSWDILDTTDRQKSICYLLLRNRRKKAYGHLDGNPLSLSHFKELDPTIKKSELHQLVKIGILQAEEYSFSVHENPLVELTDDERLVLNYAENDTLVFDKLTSNRVFKLKRISISKTISSLKEKQIVACEEIRYDFKHTKISSGLWGVNRIFLPSSNIFSTLVASDTNDYVTWIDIKADNEEDYKAQFLDKVYKKGNYRKITKEEACRMQGFPENFILPPSRARWMKLLGNSVSVPVIEMLGHAILNTGVFDERA